MIFIEVFYALIGVFLALTAYAFYDTENRLYGNLIAEFIVVVLAFYIAVLAITGTIVDHNVVANGTVANVSSPFINTTYSWVDENVAPQNTAIMGIFMFAGSVLGIHWLLLIVEAVRETIR